MRQFLILFLLPSWVFSQIDLPDNFKSDFTQMITNTKKNVITYTGKVHFSDVKNFKWSYLTPTKKEVCTNGLELLVVDHDLEQVSAYFIAKGLDISKVLTQAVLHKNNIYLADYQGKRYTIQLGKNNQLHSIAYFDELDNKVQIIFKNMKYAKGKLKSNEMICNYPVEYDLIRG
jgi:outer membrane lipoprotein carrier protein